MAGDRTEKATPRKRQKAREQGDRVRSRELLSSSAMLAGVLALGLTAPAWVGAWGNVYQRVLAAALHPAQGEEGIELMLAMRNILLSALWPLALLMAAAAAASLLAGVVQGGGLNFTAQNLRPKLARFNPVTNLGNLFSFQAASRLGKSLLPAALLVVLAVGKIRQQSQMPALSVVRLPAMLAQVHTLLLYAAWTFFAWSAVDFGLEWRGWERRIRMTKEEMREEFKQTEGNPQVRGRIRSIQRTLRRRKMQADVSRASVVITNPTHYAVALSFDFDTMEAPKVLAKGRNLLAEQIKSDARWAGVPIIENPPLARSLYRTVEPGQPIPFELYAAVAAILAYLYRQRVEEQVKREQAARAHAAASAGPLMNTGRILP
jgi:flagellar biosynthetic protein FlhB